MQAHGHKQRKGYKYSLSVPFYEFLCLKLKKPVISTSPSGGRRTSNPLINLAYSFAKKGVNQATQPLTRFSEITLMSKIAKTFPPSSLENYVKCCYPPFSSDIITIEPNSRSSEQTFPTKPEAASTPPSLATKILPILRSRRPPPKTEAKTKPYVLFLVYMQDADRQRN